MKPEEIHQAILDGCPVYGIVMFIAIAILEIDLKYPETLSLSSRVGFYIANLMLVSSVLFVPTLILWIGERL